MSYTEQHLHEAADILQRFDVASIERTADLLAQLRARAGRLFLLGVGGSAANCSHAVNDFRKICGIEAYAPTDNVSELTARTNDEGWASVFSEWLKETAVSPAGRAISLDSLLAGREQRNAQLHAVKWTAENTLRIASARFRKNLS